MNRKWRTLIFYIKYMETLPSIHLVHSYHHRVLYNRFVIAPPKKHTGSDWCQ